MVENLPANAGDASDIDSVPRLGRSPGDLEWQPTPVFLPGTSMDTGAYQATVHGLTKSQT